MTRKCALCKQTNYKNGYSFFSAPKDPEIRKKWQVVLAISDNYMVTDNTYVCSRHFHKNDIITYWISGVPPQEIKIKYKKCRLRPGAVPGRNLHLQSISKKYSDKHQINTNYSTSKKKQTSVLSNEDETFLIPRKEKNPTDNEYTINKNACHQTYSKILHDCVYTENNDLVQLSEDMDISMYDSGSEKSKSIKEKALTTHENSIFTKATTESIDMYKQQIPIESVGSQTTEHTFKTYDPSEEDETSVEIWEHDSTDSYAKDELLNNNFKTIDDLYINNKVLTRLENNHLDDKQIFSEANENEILFEDFLEIYTEVCIPRGWSYLVTSKGYGITVVYLCMGIAKNGMPFVEKQIFIKSDMILHCAVANKEIDPLAHNLIKDGKRIKLGNLLDIEELVDEFHQRIICKGMCNSTDYKDIDVIKTAYNDGIKWRHISCPLIINNGSSRCTKCTKCITLFHTSLYKSQKLLPSYKKLVKR